MTTLVFDGTSVTGPQLASAQQAKVGDPRLILDQANVKLAKRFLRTIVLEIVTINWRTSLQSAL